MSRTIMRMSTALIAVLMGVGWSTPTNAAPVACVASLDPPADNHAPHRPASLGLATFDLAVAENGAMTRTEPAGLERLESDAAGTTSSS